MKYVAKKTLTLIITLFIVSLLAFLAFQIIPGDPTTKMLGTEATEEAIAALRETLDRRPEDGAARAHVAEVCERAGDLECARPSLEWLFQKSPRSVVHARRLARFYERQGQPERAAAVLKKSGEAPRPAMRPLPPSRN